MQSKVDQNCLPLLIIKHLYSVIYKNNNMLCVLNALF